MFCSMILTNESARCLTIDQSQCEPVAGCGALGGCAVLRLQPFAALLHSAESFQVNQVSWSTTTSAHHQGLYFTLR